MTVPRSLTQRDVLLRSARFALLGALRLSQMRHHWLQHLREGASTLLIFRTLINTRHKVECRVGSSMTKLTSSSLFKISLYSRTANFNRLSKVWATSNKLPKSKVLQKLLNFCTVSVGASLCACAVSASPNLRLCAYAVKAKRQSAQRSTCTPWSVETPAKSRDPGGPGPLPGPTKSDDQGGIPPPRRMLRELFSQGGLLPNRLIRFIHPCRFLIKYFFLVDPCRAFCS